MSENTVYTGKNDLEKIQFFPGIRFETTGKYDILLLSNEHHVYVISMKGE